MRLKIASRKSDLARLQAYLVAEKIKEQDSNINIVHEFSASFGDKNPNVSLNEMPEKGAFTSDFVIGLKEGLFDMVVHSWKDLPTDLPETSTLFTLKREDPRDVLFIKKSSLEKIKKKSSISVLTSSPRRVHHIEPFLKDYYPHPINEVSCHEVRGNIPTRLKKLIEQDEDGLIMAKAALDRLLTTKLEEFTELKNELAQYLTHFNFMVLPLSCYPTAAAQGALAIEVLKSRTDLTEYLKKIHCEETFKNVKKERDLLKSLGGGCHQKVGMTSVPHKKGSFFSASGLKPNGEVIKTIEFVDKFSESPIKQFKRDESYPTNDNQNNLFTREFLDITIEPNKDLFISKELSLPKSYRPMPQQMIATAGLKTWKILAKRGIWVNTTSDSLGSHYGTNIENLIGRALNWTSLTHSDSPKKYETFEQCATYKLVKRNIEDSQDLSQYKNFYWMSGTQFKRALELHPGIKDAWHCCGAGKTFEEITEIIPKERVKIYLTKDIWYKETIND